MEREQESERKNWNEKCNKKWKKDCNKFSSHNNEKIASKCCRYLTTGPLVCIKGKWQKKRNKLSDNYLSNTYNKLLFIIYCNMFNILLLYGVRELCVVCIVCCHGGNYQLIKRLSPWLIWLTKQWVNNEQWTTSSDLIQPQHSSIFFFCCWLTITIPNSHCVLRRQCHKRNNSQKNEIKLKRTILCYLWVCSWLWLWNWRKTFLVWFF